MCVLLCQVQSLETAQFETGPELVEGQVPSPAQRPAAPLPQPRQPPIPCWARRASVSECPSTAPWADFHFSSPQSPPAESGQEAAAAASAAAAQEERRRPAPALRLPLTVGDPGPAAASLSLVSGRGGRGAGRGGGRGGSPPPAPGQGGAALGRRIASHRWR